MKASGVGLGASLLGINSGITAATTSARTTRVQSDDYYDLTADVPDDAWDLWQAKPDVREEFETVDASNYDGRNGNLSNRIEEAADQNAIVDLGSGIYEMESTVSVHSGTVGIVGDGARIYYVGADDGVEWLFETTPDYLVMEGVTFDISEDPGNGLSTDVGILSSNGIGSRAWLEDVRLDGSRHRQQIIDGELETVGGWGTFLVQAADGATAFIHRCEFPDGGTSMMGEHPDADTHDHAYGPNADPAHDGLNVWKECVAEGFHSNAFYVHSNDEAGRNVLWDCTARNNGRGNMRISHNDQIIGGVTEVTDRPDGEETQNGTPFVVNAGDNMSVIGLEIIADGPDWGNEVIQIRTEADEIAFEKTVVHIRGGSNRPIRTGTPDADVDVTFEDCCILDEGSNNNTFWISSRYENDSDVYFEDDVRVASDNGNEFNIGSVGTLHHDGDTYSDTTVSAADLGLESPVDDDGNLPAFSFEYEDDENGDDETPGTVIDNFEDGNLDNYSVETEATVTQSGAYRGDYGLELDGDSGFSGAVRSDTGLNAYPGRNDRWEFWWNTQTLEEAFYAYFGTQSDDYSETFRLGVSFDDAESSLWFQERGADGDSYLGSTDVPVETATWYRLVVDGTDGDDWTISIDTGDGTETIGELTTDSTQYTGYERSSIAYWISGNDRMYFDEITIREQNDGDDGGTGELVVDDFAESGLDEWQIPSQTGTVDAHSDSYDNSYALRCYDDGLTRAFANEDNSPSLENFPQPGDLWEFYVQIHTPGLTRFQFGRQGSEGGDGHYRVELSSSGFRVDLHDGSSSTTVGTGEYGLSYDTGTWYRVRHWWHHPDQDEDHVCELYDTATEEAVATVSGNDTTWEDGDIGVWANDETDVSFDLIRILDRTQ
ncbi:hypothetical protein [Halostagnicola bangensis]